MTGSHRARRVAPSLVLAALIALIGLRPAAAVGELWTLVALPPTATAGQLTTFTLTATNLLVLDDVGCLEVDLPGSFQSVSAAIVESPDGRWRSRVTGTNVEVYSENGGGRLDIGQSVTFTITARPTVAGAVAWANHAHEQQDCGGADLPGVALPVTVLPQLQPTPTPMPVPTPAPTVAPTPPPGAAPTLPPPAVTAPPTPVLPRPGSSTPTPAPDGVAERSPRPTDQTPASSSSAAPDDRPRSAASPDAGVVSRAPDLPPSPPGALLPHRHGIATVAYDGASGVSLDLASLAAFDGLGTWAVPAYTLGLSGLIVVLWVGLQALGALAWIPAVRRLRGDDAEPEAA